jgi:hypothetical protein
MQADRSTGSFRPALNVKGLSALKSIHHPGTGVPFPPINMTAGKLTLYQENSLKQNWKRSIFIRLTTQGFALQKVYTDDRGIDEIAEARIMMLSWYLRVIIP